VRLDFRRWGVFNLVGAVGFVLQIGTIALLTRWFGWPSVIATAVGLELAAFHNFFGHSRWTWRECPAQTFRGWAIRYGRYQIAKTASLLASLAITTSIVLLTECPVELANVMAVLICALPNYFVAERLVFSR
jgi:putative flippase GtrA